MNSIADKFKKFLPTSTDNVPVHADSANAATLSLDHAETIQPPEEKTVMFHREPIHAVPVEPAFEPPTETISEAVPEAPAAAPEPVAPPRERAASPLAASTLIGTDPARQQHLRETLLGLLAVVGSSKLSGRTPVTR